MIPRFECGVYSSLAAVLPTRVLGKKIARGTALIGEKYSFQIAFRYVGNPEAGTVLPVAFRPEGEIPKDRVKVFRVGNVAAANAVPNKTDPAQMMSAAPGLYPDPLFEMDAFGRVEYDEAKKRFFEEGQRRTVTAYPARQALWIEIDTAGLEARRYAFEGVFQSLSDGKELARARFSLEILPVKIAKPLAPCSQWFYCDALARLYGVKLWSKRHFEIIGNFLETAAEHGIDTVLVPAFTPALDTRVGKERLCVQLVKIEKRGGGYAFDFSLLRRFLALCLKAGMTKFEHAPLFTQWGAAHAPAIYAKVNGKSARLFGWETDAGSEEYAAFLRAYLSALLAELDPLGLTDSFVFHISDEPHENDVARYRSGRDLVKSVSPRLVTMDALSRYEFYEKGLVDIPVVREISPDLGLFAENCPNFRLYYTGGKIFGGHTNRLITQENARCRLLGLHLYAVNARGFLHWGYNYYSDTLTHGLFDPFTDPCFFFGSPGTSFSVYPAPDGTAIPSIRLKITREALSDHRALLMLEEKIGRAATLSLIRETVGEVTADTAVDEAGLLRLRDRVNRALAE